MNRRHFLTSAAAVTAALLLGFGAPVAAGAQGRPGGGGFGGGGQGFGGPMMMGRGGQNNPAQSAVMTLLNRDDVRSELLISAQQREQLTALEQDGQKAVGQKMRDFFQNSNFNPQDFQNMTPEERQAKQQEIQQQVQSIIQNYQVDMDKHLAKILTSKATGGVSQIDRLHQLDLQWRGPLSLVDKTVAEQLPLTPEQGGKVQPIYQDYQTKTQQAMQKAMGDVRALFQGNGDGTPPDRQAIQKEMQKRMTAAQPEIEKIKKESSDKVVALLTPEQQQKWKDLQGKPFKFRTSDTPRAF